MGRKLAGLFGIAAATLAFGIGSAVEAGHTHSSPAGHSVQADIQGPTVTPADIQGPTKVQVDIQGPTATPSDIQGPTATPADIQGPTATPSDIQGPTTVRV